MAEKKNIKKAGAKKTVAKKAIAKKYVSKKDLIKQMALQRVNPQIIEVFSHVKGFPTKLTETQWRQLGTYLSNVSKEIEAKKSGKSTSAISKISIRSKKSITKARRSERDSNERTGRKIIYGAAGAVGGAAAHAIIGGAGLAIAGTAIAVGLAPFAAAGASLALIANTLFGD